MKRVTQQEAVEAVKTLLLMTAENKSPLMELKSTVGGERVGLVICIGKQEGDLEREAVRPAIVAKTPNINPASKCCDLLEKAANDIKAQAGLNASSKPFTNPQNN